MKTICLPGNHHNDFVATHALGYMMYGYTLLVPVNQKVFNKVSKEHNISGHKWFTTLLLRFTHQRECKLVFCSVLGGVYVGRIYSSNAKDLKFDWSIQVTWKRRAYLLVHQHEGWQIIIAVIFSYPCWCSWFIFTKQIIIVLFWVIIYSYLQKFFKIGVLKELCTIRRKTLVLESHFNQPVSCYFSNKRLRHRSFLVNFAKLSKTPFLQNTLGLLLLYLLNISAISQNLTLISESGFSNHLR